MLPVFVDEFEAVAVRVDDLCCVVTGVVVGKWAGRDFIACAGLQRGRVHCPHFRLRMGNEADMNRPG